MSIIQLVNFTDGEGVDPIDFVSMQRAALAQLVEPLISRLGVSDDGLREAPPLLGARVLGGDCQPLPSATALRIDPRPGILYFPVGAELDPGGPAGSFFPPAVTGAVAESGSGSEPTTIPFWASATDLRTVHDPGDAQPRWDVVYLSVSWVNGPTVARDFKDAVTGALTTSNPSKRRIATLTKTLAKGTPAAAPIMAADTPIGTVPLYAVYVPAGHTGVFTNDQIVDFRHPLGYYHEDVYAVDAWNRGAFTGSWTRIAGGAFGAMAAANNTDTLTFVPQGPRGSQARLVGVSALVGNPGIGGAMNVHRFNASNYGTPEATLIPLSDLAGGSVAAGSAVWKSQWATDGFKPAPTFNGRFPAWITGNYNPIAAAAASGTNAFTRLGVTYTSQAVNARISLVRFTFAGGL
jgi:hypothetical protein